jgi:hypothetical protein
MAADQEHLDDGEEAQLAWLLTSAHDAPEMREEFVRVLAQRLELEFSAHVARGAGLQSNGVASRNGAARTGMTDVLSGISTHPPRQQGSPHDPDVVTLSAAKSQRGPHRRRRRWLMVSAVAAALLVAASLWSDPPAWAAMFRAIVAGIGQLTGGGPAAEGDALPGNETGPSGDVGSKIVAEGEGVDAPPPDVIAKSVLPAAPPSEAERVEFEPAWEPAAAENLSQRVDERLAALWLARGIHPAGSSSDAEFLRRVFLDLTGRIPTVSEVHEFFDDISPDRREKLVDRLLAHRDHATHLAAVWRGVLLPDDVDLSRYGGAEKFEEWLAERFAANKPYDQIVRDLLLAEGRVSQSGPLLFYAALRLNPEELAARTSRAFLGMRMECAQCHDHPFDEKVSQHDFWSFAAFFARISRPRGKMEMTSPVLAVRDNEQGDVVIPESDEVVLPKLPQTGAELEDSADGASRREELAKWLTSKENRRFAQATVNRVWSQLFGRGLVEPVDDMRPTNPPIAPDVLELVSADFAASGFDLRRLLRALVLTQAYQLTSRSELDDPSRAMHFAQMNMKSFTAEQLYDCIAVATQRAAMAGGSTNESGLVRFSDADRQAFLQQFRAPPGQATDYQAGIPQALTLMHGSLIHSATDLGTSGLLKSLAAPFFSDQQRLDALFLSTLSRYPEPQEREAMLKVIASATNDEERQQALGDVLWALLNSAEFTFNH